MNDQTNRLKAPPAQDHRFNQRALVALNRELRGQLDRGAAWLKTSRRDPDAEALDWACTKWPDLDQLAFRRSVAAVVHAAGFGFGVESGETDDLESREPARIAAAARRVTARMRKLVGANEADGRLLVQSGLACTLDDD